jgi:hypothetical protein
MVIIEMLLSFHSAFEWLLLLLLLLVSSVESLVVEEAVVASIPVLIQLRGMKIEDSIVVVLL